MEDIKFEEVQNLLDSGKKPGKIFDDVLGEKEGFRVVVLNDKQNYIDSNNKLLSPNQWFDDSRSFNGGFGKIKYNEKYNLINKKGELVFDIWFDENFFNDPTSHFFAIQRYIENINVSNCNDTSLLPHYVKCIDFLINNCPCIASDECEKFRKILDTYPTKLYKKVRTLQEQLDNIEGHINAKILENYSEEYEAFYEAVNCSQSIDKSEIEDMFIDYIKILTPIVSDNPICG